MNPIIHTQSSMKKHNGQTDEDFNKFLSIHKKMDCSKMYFSDNRHRALTHHMVWINEVMIPLYGNNDDFLSGNKKSHIRTEHSMKTYKGQTDVDYNKFLSIHKKMEYIEQHFNDVDNLFLKNTMFWVNEAMLPLYGDYIVLSNNNKISVKDICETHILFNFRMKFIPTVQDYIQEMNMKDWMQNGNGIPNSYKSTYIDDESYDSYIKLSNDEKVSVKDICKTHILEDFRMRYIPTLKDYTQELEIKPWMDGGKGIPNSAKKLYKDFKINNTQGLPHID